MSETQTNTEDDTGEQTRLQNVRNALELRVVDVAQEMANRTDYATNTMRRAVSRIENGKEPFVRNENTVRQAYVEAVAATVANDAEAVQLN